MTTPSAPQLGLSLSDASLLHLDFFTLSQMLG